VTFISLLVWKRMAATFLFLEMNQYN